LSVPKPGTLGRPLGDTCFAQGWHVYSSVASDQLVVGRPGYDPVELGAVVVDQADIFSHYVVNFPLVPHLMKLVVE